MFVYYIGAYVDRMHGKVGGMLLCNSFPLGMNLESSLLRIVGSWGIMLLVYMKNVKCGEICIAHWRKLFFIFCPALQFLDGRIDVKE